MKPEVREISNVNDPKYQALLLERRVKDKLKELEQARFALLLQHERRFAQLQIDVKELETLIETLKTTK